MVLFTNLHPPNNAHRTISKTLADLFNSQLSSVSKLARQNSSFLWSFVNSSLANSSKSQQQMVI